MRVELKGLLSPRDREAVACLSPVFQRWVSGRETLEKECERVAVFHEKKIGKARSQHVVLYM